MQVHLVVSPTDTPEERALVQNILAAVHSNTAKRIAPEDNPAVGGGVPPAPVGNVAQSAAVAGAQQIAPATSTPAMNIAIQASAVPSVPPALIAPATPSGPANVGMPEFDSANLPWDERIHSDTKNKNKDGTWRTKRGVDKAIIPAIEAQLRAQYGTTAPVKTNPYEVPGVAPETAAAVAAGHPVTVDPMQAQKIIEAGQAHTAAHLAAVTGVPTPPATATPIAPSPEFAAAREGMPAAPVDPMAPFTNFIRQVGPMIRTEANPAGVLSSDVVSGTCKMLGIVDGAGNGSLIEARNHLHMIDALRSILNAQHLAPIGATLIQ